MAHQMSAAIGLLANLIGGVANAQLNPQDKAKLEAFSTLLDGIQISIISTGILSTEQVEDALAAGLEVLLSELSEGAIIAVGGAIGTLIAPGGGTAEGLLGGVVASFAAYIADATDTSSGVINFVADSLAGLIVDGVLGLASLADDLAALNAYVESVISDFADDASDAVENLFVPKGPDFDEDGWPN